MRKRRGPRTEPCGTPQLTVSDTTRMISTRILQQQTFGTLKALFVNIHKEIFSITKRPVSDVASLEKRAKLVIIGTGWAGYSVLKTVNKKAYNVYVVSVRNHFLFTPLLTSTTVGTLEFRSIIEPIRNAGFESADHFHLSRAMDIDVEKQVVVCRSELATNSEATYELPYDKCIIAVGCLTNTFNTPGANTYAHFLKEIEDARKIRNKIVSNFELALQPNVTNKEKRRLLHTVIVGGGPTGVEFGAELYDFVLQDVSRLYGQEAEDVRVTLVEGAQILSSFDPRLQAFAEKKIRARGRFELIKGRVVEVTPESVHLDDGRVLSCGLAVWSTGLSPRLLTQHLPWPKRKTGQLLTNEFLQVKHVAKGNVYAVGDCADIESMSLPCTAQVAEREGRYLGKSLNLLAKGKSPEPFRFRNLGMLAYIGGFQGVADVPGIKLRGFSSWLLWRSAYLTRLGSFRLRLQVPFDWFKTFFFGRDISRF